MYINEDMTILISRRGYDPQTRVPLTMQQWKQN